MTEKQQWRPCVVVLEDGWEILKRGNGDGDGEMTEGRKMTEGRRTWGLRDKETEGWKRRKNDGAKGRSELLCSSTTMNLLRKSNHIVATDIVAPGGAQRNPGFANAERPPFAVAFWKKQERPFRTEGENKGK